MKKVCDGSSVPEKFSLMTDLVRYETSGDQSAESQEIHKHIKGHKTDRTSARSLNEFLCARLCAGLVTCGCNNVTQ